MARIVLSLPLGGVRVTSLTLREARFHVFMLFCLPQGDPPSDVTDTGGGPHSTFPFCFHASRRVLDGRPDPERGPHSTHKQKHAGGIGKT